MEGYNNPNARDEDHAMPWTTVILSGAVMLALAAVMAVVLGWAKRRWAVHEDPLVKQVQAALAGLDCGACGHPTCNDYAHAIVDAGDPIDKCLPGGASSARAVADILGVAVPEVGRQFAVVHCGARNGDHLPRRAYRGEPTCAAANIISGVQDCVYGCLGLGDCERACPFDAIGVIEGLAVVDFARCTACGACVRACPRDIITIETFKAERMLVIACCNRDEGRQTRAVCKVGCIACGRCKRQCDLFEVVDNLSTVDYKRYDPGVHGEALRAAGQACPTGCLPFRPPTAETESS